MIFGEYCEWKLTNVKDNPWKIQDFEENRDNYQDKKEIIKRTDKSKINLYAREWKSVCVFVSVWIWLAAICSNGLDWNGCQTLQINTKS